MTDDSRRQLILHSMTPLKQIITGNLKPNNNEKTTTTIATITKTTTTTKQIIKILIYLLYNFVFLTRWRHILYNNNKNEMKKEHNQDKNNKIINNDVV